MKRSGGRSKDPRKSSWLSLLKCDKIRFVVNKLKEIFTYVVWNSTPRRCKEVLCEGELGHDCFCHRPSFTKCSSGPITKRQRKQTAGVAGSPGSQSSVTKLKFQSA